MEHPLDESVETGATDIFGRDDDADGRVFWSHPTAVDFLRSSGRPDRKLMLNICSVRSVENG